MRNRIFALILIIGLLGLLAACGGGSTFQTPGGGDATPTITPPSGQEQGSLEDWADNQDLTQSPVLYRGIPSVPVDGEHESSQLTDGDFVVLGKDALDYSQCEISGTAMIINPGTAAASNPDGIPAWAMYRVSGLRGLSPLSLNVECQPADLGDQYSVAVADYITLEWFWFGPTSLPELEADLTMDGHRFVTNIGNLYFLVVCGGTNTATHYQSTVVTGAPGGNEPPGAPARLAASKGEFPDGVALTWTPGDGADYYQIWRKATDIYTWDGGGDPGVRPGDPGLPPDDPDLRPPGDPNFAPIEWEQIARTEATQYFDATALPGLTFMYKVRAVNDVGMSAFSNIDEGWAFFEVPPPPPPMFEGIHGYVFGSLWLGDGTDPNIDPLLPPGDPGLPPDGGNGDPGVPPCPDLLPLTGATITVGEARTDGTWDGPVWTAETNADGFYQLLGVPPGVYVIFAELEGWFFPESFTFEVVVPDESQQFDFIGWPDEGRPWDDPAGVHGWVMNGTFLLSNEPPDPGTGPMPRMLPLPDVRITFSGLETDQIGAEVYTDENGFYQVTDIAPGEYIVSPYLAGWYFDPPEQIVIIGDEVPSMRIDFLGFPGDPPPPPDPDRTGIFGTAWGDYNDMLPAFEPLAGVEITLSAYPEEIVLAQYTTGEDGQFAFPNLAAGEYLVSANLAGWEFQPPDYLVELSGDMPLALLDFWGYEEGNFPGDPDR